MSLLVSCRARWLLCLIGIYPAFCQNPEASVRVTISTKDTKAAQGVSVTIKGEIALTDSNGVAVIPVGLGLTNISVTKEGFFPAATSLDVNEAREWQITFEL